VHDLLLQFLSPEETKFSDIKRMQAMFPRIMAGDFNPLPPTVRHFHQRLLAGRHQKPRQMVVLELHCGR
jgi:hypothetical protein